MFRKLVISLVIIVLSLGLLATDSKDLSVIWTEVCYAGTWIVIDSPLGYSEWSTWCANFNPESRKITWMWGKSCNPSWGTKVVIWETLHGYPRAFCKYR